MKKYIKSKSVTQSPNATGPGFRTPDHFKGSVFGGNPPVQASKFGGSNLNAKSRQVGFDPSRFKTQHKG